MFLSVSDNHFPHHSERMWLSVRDCVCLRQREGTYTVIVLVLAAIVLFGYLY